jgi:hypothetical protein
MKKLTAICYGLSAACFTIAVKAKDEDAFWKAHYLVGWCIGAGIPLSLCSAWLIEHKPFWWPRSGAIVGAWIGAAVAVFGISGFLMSISFSIGLGFIGGISLLASLANAPRDRPAQKKLRIAADVAGEEEPYQSEQRNVGVGPATPDGAPPSHRASSSEKTARAQSPRG